MFGLARKKSAHHPQSAMPDLDMLAQISADGASEDLASTLRDSFHMLEMATLALDGITHAVSEARLYARLASRPEGLAQRGLMAERYAILRREIEQRVAEAALTTGDAIAVALGGTQNAAPDCAVVPDLPVSSFSSTAEAHHVTTAADKMLFAIEKEAERFREAAGHIADSLERMELTRGELTEAGDDTKPTLLDEFVPADEAPLPALLQHKRNRAA